MWVLAGALGVWYLLRLPSSAVAETPSLTSAVSAETSPKEPPKAAPKPAKGRQVLAIFKAPPYDFELAIPKCTASKDWGSFRGTPRCPFEIRLLEKGKSLAVVQLDAASCGPAKLKGPLRSMGSDLEAGVWVTGYDRCRSDVAARAVELAPDVTGLLITSRAGAEHPTRQHRLVVRRDRKLETAWAAEEIGDPSSMSTRVIPTNLPHQNDIAFIETYTPPLEAATSLTATRLHVQTRTGQIVKSPLPDAQTPLFLMRAGQFRTPDEAYEARSRESCLAPYVVLKPELLSSLSPPCGAGSTAGESILGLLLARKEDAVAAQEELGRCAPALKPTLVECAVEK